MTRKTPASAAFAGHIVRIAEYLAYSEQQPSWLVRKQARRAAGEAIKSPAQYRLDELAPMNANLRGEYPNHHLARGLGWPEMR